LSNWPKKWNWKWKQALRDREKRHRKINERNETAKGEEGLEPKETVKIGAYA